MKKSYFYLVFFLSSLLMITSCSKEDNVKNEDTPVLFTKVIVKVSAKNLDNYYVPAKDVGVYMFDKPISGTFGIDPKQAVALMITNSQGKAVFRLNDFIDRDPNKKVHTFYFAILKKQPDDSYSLRATSSISVEKGDVIDISLNM